jgi:hypothetical protein
MRCFVKAYSARDPRQTPTTGRPLNPPTSEGSPTRAPQALLPQPSRIEAAAKALTQLEALQAAPTWENFQKLPYQQQYLVAGRYTYPSGGWHFKTKAVILDQFK